MSDPAAPPARTVLRDLPLAARLTLALFMISVGLGYFSALVNLHFQQASPGELLPTKKDVVTNYHGSTDHSQLVRLLVTNDTAPFNGQGSMKAAFTTKAPTDKAIADKAEKQKVDLDKLQTEADEQKIPIEETKTYRRLSNEVMKDFDGERLALIHWLTQDSNLNRIKKAYDEDKYLLPQEDKALQITEKFVDDDAQQGRYVKVQAIFRARCARCHRDNGQAAHFPLTSWRHLARYLKAEAREMSEVKLALSTHVHLLGFSMLYGLTGLVFAFSSYPGVIRLVIAPLPLLAQIVDISFWWLARLDPPYGPQFAQGIMLTGGIVGAGLGLQILLSLFNLFGKTGKVVLVVLMAGAVAVGFYVKTNVIDAHLAKERILMTTEE